MIKINLESIDGFDETDDEFFSIAKGGLFSFENSLRAVAEWESKYKKPFLNANQKTPDEIYDFFTMCAIGKRPDIKLFQYGNVDAVNKLNQYIAEVPTATVIENDDVASNGEYPTSESIYAMLAMAGMDYSCDRWNINRLIMTLRIIAEKNKPEKKMSVKETMLSNKQINERRKHLLGTKG